ncbi:MAG: sugar kinase [Cardiobacteriaceae bacterium]|nr:sugar kinase [Cardiobacteriaceae bacterium]
MKILTIGEILAEIVATSKGDGFLDVQPLLGPFPSGAPAIFIDQAGKLGAPCAIISRVGDDDFGRLNLERLRRDGVDISGVAVARGEATGSAFVRYREDGSRRFVFNIAHSACGRLEKTAEAARLMEECSHLHLMGSALSAPGMRDVALDAMQRIKARGGTLSFDPNLRAELLDMPGMRDALTQTLAQTDIFLPSGDELYLFTRAQEEDAAIAELLARGIGEIVLKRGERGATHFSAQGRIDAPPIAVEEKDPTGAGDSFGGAFIALRLAGHDAGEALRYANAAGACAVTVVGPMEGTSTRAELDALLAQAR